LRFASSIPARSNRRIPLRGPPLWDGCGDAQIDHGVRVVAAGPNMSNFSRFQNAQLIEAKFATEELRHDV